MNERLVLCSLASLTLLASCHHESSSSTLAAIAVSPADPSIAKGTTQQFTATGTYTGGATEDLTTQVTWASSDGAVAAVLDTAGSNGLATSTGEGSTSLSASLGGVSGTTSLTVTAAVLVSIEVTPTNSSLALGTQQQLTATGIFTDGSTEDLTAQITWASSDGTIAAISNAAGSAGLVTSTSVGSATLSASLAGVSGATSLTVTAAFLLSIEVTPTNPSLAKGTTQQLTASGIFTDGSTQDLTTQVTWASSDGAVAAISNVAGSHGLATSTDVGSAIVSASYTGVSGTTMLTVSAAVLVSIEVTPTNRSLAQGTTQQLTATGIFTDGSTQGLTTQVGWASSDAGVAKVSGPAGTEGLATGVGIGSAILSATLAGVSGTTALTVTAAVLLSLDVTPTIPSIADGTAQPFAATGTYTDGSTQDLTTQVTWASSDEAVATLSNAAGSNGLATSIGLGSATVSATRSGVSGTTTLAVTAATLASIDVTPADPSLAKGTTQQLTATGTYTDGSTQDVTAQVTWASSDGAVATLSNAAGSNGLATSLGVGSTTLSATLAGVSRATMLTVTDAALLWIDVTPTNPSIAKGTTLPFAATGTYTDGSTQALATQVTWASSDGAVATISNAAGSNGLATSIEVGSATLSATLSGVNGATTLTVMAAILVSIDVTPAGPSIAQGTTRQFTATGTYTSGSSQDLTTQVTWGSSDGTVATISNAAGSEGLAVGVGLGSATLSAALAGVSGTTALTVTAAALLSIDVTPTSPSIASGTTQPFIATGSYSGGSTQDLTTQINWASSDSNVATISNTAGSEGLATGVGVGSAILSATLAGVSGTTVLTVTAAALVSIDVTPTNPSIAGGTTQPLIATGTYSDGSTQDLTTQVTWTSSDLNAATISNAAGSEGLATGVGLGSATLSATHAGVSGTTVLTVTAAALVSIDVTPTNPSIASGTTQPFIATGTYSNGSTQDLTTQVTWASSDSGVATISSAAGSEGLATGASAGSATLSATLAGASGTAALTVTAAVLVSIDVTPASLSLASGTTQPFIATGTYSDGSTQDLTTQVTWASSDSSAATVSNAAGSEGLATAVGVGSATLSATLSGVSGATVLTVTAAVLVSLDATPTNPSIASGTTQPFTATGIYSDGSSQDLTTQVTWASSDGTVAAISNAAGSEGLATAVGVGSATLSATLAGVSGATVLTVTAAVLVSLDATPTNPSIASGTTQPFTATGTYSNGATQDLTTQVTWVSSDPSVAAISNAAGSEGLATGLGLGSATLSATFAGVSGTTVLTVTAAALVSLDVTPASPSIASGTTQAFTATGTYSDASTQDLTTQVTWASTDTSTATVSNAAGSEGLATGVGVGSATLSATLAGVSGTTVLTVTAARLVSIDVTPTSPSIASGTTQPFTATGAYTNGSTQDLTTQVTWASSDGTVATISNAAGGEGLATGVGVGSATLSATLAGVSGTTTLAVTDPVKTYSATPGLAIPDNNTTGVTGTIDVADSLTIASIAVTTAITHTFRGDLVVTLIGPDSTSAILHNLTGGGADNLNTTFAIVATPNQPLSVFSGKNTVGAWKLRVQDLAALDLGTLSSWKITFNGEQSLTPGLAIPDNDTNGVTSAMSYTRTGTVADVIVRVNITHTFKGDLEVALIGPDGTTVLLHDRTGGAANNIFTAYPDLTAPAQSLSAFTGMAITGAWTLRVRDLTAVDVGTLDSWTLSLTAQ